ncbi:MAG: EamA family transporter [Clostridia bacterium]|nr:EamA family transporter [Clostridia bacterium]
MSSKENSAKIRLIGAMVIFGTIGIFRKYIPLPSGPVALVRVLVGVLFLLLVLAIKREKLSREAIRRNLLLLLVSGGLIGFNWILLFESYNYTSVATATLCYYMAPIFVTLAAPLVLGERLTVRKLVLALIALLGMVLVSDVLNVGVSDMGELRGILLGLSAAALYAAVILLNKKLRDISAYDRTVVQLAASFAVLLPYVLLTEDLSTVVLSPMTIALLLTVGVLHTGVAYALYFGAMRDLSAQTVALFSYIDPILAVVLSELLLNETMGWGGVVGGVLILGATFVGELWGEKKI